MKSHGLLRDWPHVAVFVLFTLSVWALAGASAIADEAGEVIRSAKSGAWSTADTWEGGKVPGQGSRVLVRQGHKVTYDVQADAVVRAINVAGTLSFARDKNTRLVTGLIKIQAGDEFSEEGFDCDAHLAELPAGTPRPALEVGTPDEPMPAGVTATIRLAYVEGMDKQSCPAIVCCGGRMDFHGAPLSRTWIKLGRTAKSGDATMTLSERVEGWRVGDLVIVTAANTQRNEGKGRRTEERRIQAIDGASVTLDKPLEFDHLGDGDYRAEVANLSRNVVVESADPDGVRGHTMYHRGSAGAISFAEFRHLGKRDTLGRYSLHFHLVGETMRGSYVIGASIWDSHNRWLTIHGTNYLVARDNVGYKSVGHGFFLEDGTEVYNVLDCNLAVQANRGKKLPKQVLPFDQNDGAGFWWANSLNTFTRNVSVESGQYGYRYEATPTSALKLDLSVMQPDGTRTKVDIRTLPFLRFEDNESHSEAGLYAFNLGEGVSRVGPDSRRPFVVRNFKAWDVHYAFRPQVPSLLVENLTIHKAAYGVYHPHYFNHVYRNVVISQTNTEPFNRGHDDLSAQYGVLTVDGLTFLNNHMYGMPLIQISDDNPTGEGATHIRNLKVVNFTGGRERSIVNLGGGPRPQPKTEKGVPIYVHDYFGPGRHAKIVSTRAKDWQNDGREYRSESPLTGDESRVTEVSDVEFPTLLDPVDDLPPATVITHVRRKDGAVIVRGTTSDNGTVKRVVVSGQEATATAANFAEWQITLSSAEKSLSAHAEDAAGNVERLRHVVEAH
ncbi:MAG: G8 domain-containing protein [Planctomycetia bacterium]|nr:G8 domain-containing protein [Planctomycetia bacterium]